MPTLIDAKPLIMGTRSIIAWQAHAKTQTRRLVKPQPDDPSWELRELRGGWAYLQPGWLPSSPPKRVYWLAKIRQPYAVGDICWIREALERGPNNQVLYRADSVGKRCVATRDRQG